MSDSAPPPSPPPSYGQPPYASSPYPPPSYGQPPYASSPYPPPSYAYPPSAAAPPTNGLAIASLVSAFFISLLAVILGHIALGQIKRTGEGGKGLATAGLILGYIGLVVGLIAIIAMVALFSNLGWFFLSLYGSGYEFS